VNDDRATRETRSPSGRTTVGTRPPSTTRRSTTGRTAGPRRGQAPMAVPET